MARKQYGLSDKDKSIIEPIIQEINNQELQELEQIFGRDIAQLKKDAANFLQIILETQERIRNIENMMLAQKNLRNQIRKELGVTGRFLSQYETEEYRQRREELNVELRNQEVERVYQAAFDFHDQINNILGQKVVTIIVLQDKENNPYVFEIGKDEIFNNNILNYEETSKTSRLSARFKTSLNQMQQAGFKAIERDDLNINDNLNLMNLNIAYKNILYRYDTYNQLVMWLFPKGQWNWSKVSARGDIAEAYSMFFLKKAEYDFQSSNKEENINYFMVLGVAEVNNISGLLQGDISSGQYEYAIKSADASYMSVQQMIPLAQKIVVNDKYTIADLKKKKEELARKKAKIRNPIFNSVDNQVSKDLEQAFSDLTS